MFFRSHDASIPEKKLNAYEDIWVKCEVGPKNPHIFFLRQQKKEKTLKEPPSKILKSIRGKVALFQTETYYEAMIIKTI